MPSRARPTEVFRRAGLRSGDLHGRTGLPGETASGKAGRARAGSGASLGWKSRRLAWLARTSNAQDCRASRGHRCRSARLGRLQRTARRGLPVQPALCATGHGALRTVSVCVNAGIVILRGSSLQLLPQAGRAGGRASGCRIAPDPQQCRCRPTKRQPTTCCAPFVATFGDHEETCPVSARQACF